MLLLPVLFGLLGVGVGDHGGSAGSPLRGANFTILVSVLEGLDETEELVDIAADGQITDGHVSHDTLVVDDVGGTEGDALLLDEAAVVARDLERGVSKHGDVHGTETTLLAILLSVLLVREVRVGGAGNDLAAELLEFSGLVGELADLSGAHEGEVKRIEEEQHVLALELLEADLLELVLPPGLGLEGGRRLLGLANGSGGFHLFFVFIFMLKCRKIWLNTLASRHAAASAHDINTKNVL